MLDKGLLPNVECLDTPSPGFIANTRVDRRTFPCGYEGIQHQNLLRDYHPETVQASPDPRDFEANPGSPVQRAGTPLHVPGGDDPVVSDVDPVARHDGTSGGEHRQDEAPVGTEGEPPASDGGTSALW